MNERRIDCLEPANNALACATAAAESCTRHVAELEEALRTLIARDAAPEVIEQKRAELDDARKRCADVRAAEETARDHVRATIEISFPGGGTGTPSLLGVYPAVLLPARIETRFDIRPSSTARRWLPNLMVRIYPDEIAIETHEPPLTTAEAAAAADYWARVAAGENEAEAWRRLLLIYRSTRAAWIVRVGAPGQGHGTRASSWTRPAITRVMPDRWHVRAFRGGNLVASVTGRAIVSPLTVSMDPSVDPDDPSRVEDVSGHGLLLERNLKWTVDFETAVQAGMAVRIPLQSDDVANGFDELFAVGIKESLGPGEGGTLLGQLFDSHHYTGGFAFLREETPTHNTSASRSPFPADDPGGAHSFPIERGAFPRFSGSNGERFVRALGIESNVVDHIEHANLDEYLHGRIFRDALWPGTLGYYIRRLLDPWITSGDKAPGQQYDELDAHEWSAREHFVDFVGGSALPSFRAGRKAYGIVPVTSLQRWQPDARATAIDRALPPLLRTLLSIWTAGLEGVPRIGRSNDLDADFLATLGMDWRSRTVRVRTMVGQQTHRALLALLGVDATEWASRQTIDGGAMAAVGHGGWRPLIASMSFATEADRYAHELVAAVLSETDALTPNYIRWIRNASIDALRNESYAHARPAALLYHVLRFAALAEYDRIARDLVIKTSGGDPTFALRGEPQFIGIDEPVETAWSRFELQLPVTGSQTIGEYILDPAREGEPLPGAWSYRTGLDAIENLPTAELDRLFATTLDLCSHRLDPWILSLPAKRLDAMRDRSRTGAYLGGYGWVVNVRPPGEEPTVVLVDGRVAAVRGGRGGYIHSAELTQASAAAILRSAYAIRSGGDAERYGIDLNSARVAKAMRLLEKVSTGESLGSALGHQFERGLRRRGWIAQLKLTVDSLRRGYPLIANKLADSHEPADKVAARNVVDGLRMLDAFRDGSIVYDPLLLPPNSDRRAAVEYGLRELDETLDAVGDLLTAESVFQTVRGNTAAAGASLDALSRGGRPPSIESIRQPRSGTSLTHRFAVVLGGGNPAAPLWTAPLTPRALAEPHLDAWLGNLLGDPARIRCRALVPSPSLSGVVGELEIPLTDLQLRPIDFYYLAGDVPELEQRIARAAGSPGAGIDHTPWPDRSIRSFDEAIEVMRAARELLAASRPLRPEDLVAPLHSTAAKAQAMSGGGRAAAARSALQNARDALEVFLLAASPGTGPLLHALGAASLFGIAGTVITLPLLFPVATEEMLAAAREAVKEMDRRLAATSSPSLTDEEIVRGVFGPDFLFLREFVPYASTTLAQALADSPSLVGNPLEVPKWIRKAAPVREPLARFRTLAMYADAFGAAAPAFAVAQLPFVPGGSWVALPFADESQRPPSGCVSIVLQRAVAPPPNSPWAGLMVDEWTEVIPAATAQTAVSFEYDQPRAEAPQAVLVAVPPVPRERWSVDEVFDCVRETLQLARVRGADLETLGDIGQLIPALCITANAAGDAISVPLTTLLERPVSTLPET